MSEIQLMMSNDGRVLCAGYDSLKRPRLDG